jgi:hypothetical protein
VSEELKSGMGTSCSTCKSGAIEGAFFMLKKLKRYGVRIEREGDRLNGFGETMWRSDY